MNLSLDDTHDPALTSWVASAQAPSCDFPIQNLPYGRFRKAGSNEPWRICVAIGDQVLDMLAARNANAWPATLTDQLDALAAGDLNRVMGSSSAERIELRRALSAALSVSNTQHEALAAALLPQAEAEMAVPCRIGDYTDFYTGIHHATTVGKLFRPDNPLLPNYKWVPIGYHGRSSSVVVSGTPFRRPRGQLKGAADAPTFGPCQRLDHELELGALIGPGNALGEAVTIEQAESRLFGLTLFNDWSARDIQAWEYQPLGPFLAKNFASTISPWVVTMEALAPFRVPFARPAGDPQPLPYLASADNAERGAIDIQLEVLIQTATMRDAGLAPVTLSTSNFRDAYWTLAQLVAHHASNGCNLQPGDLLGTGTQSGPEPGQGGSMLELSQGGKQPITLPNGERRTFLEDGDTLILRAHCERPGAARIGFGEAAGRVLPALAES